MDAHFLTRDGAAWLAARDPALAGIDAINIDDTADGERPAHTLLLAAGVLVVEHLTGPDHLHRGIPGLLRLCALSVPSRSGISAYVWRLRVPEAP